MNRNQPKIEHTWTVRKGTNKTLLWTRLFDNGKDTSTVQISFSVPTTNGMCILTFTVVVNAQSLKYRHQSILQKQTKTLPGYKTLAQRPFIPTKWTTSIRDTIRFSTVSLVDIERRHLCYRQGKLLWNQGEHSFGYEVNNKCHITTIAPLNVMAKSHKAGEGVIQNSNSNLKSNTQTQICIPKKGNVSMKKAVMKSRKSSKIRKRE